MIQHLYLHIPFCHRVCPYCSFYKHTPGNTDMAAFVDAILNELTLHQRQLDLRPKTIYFGGGTPTALSRSHLTTLIHGLRQRLDLSDLQELCLEANPKTVSPAKATLLRDLGVTRVSLGVQAWDQPTLTLLGRDHAPDEATETFHILRDAGIPALNLDLMFSIPHQTLDIWTAGLHHSLSLKPDHLSCYNLTYEEDTDFLQRHQTGELDQNQDRDADHFGTTIDLLEAAGYEHYETSNFALPGRRSLHNQAYWQGADYLGLGPSASSTHQRTRWKNISDTTRYNELLSQNRVPIVESEDLTDNQWLMERIALELRTAEGLSLSRIAPSIAHWLPTLQTENLIHLTPTHLHLTREGKPLVDQIAETLIPEEPK
ncbi:radical SAM family heme chaperone HemW [Phragmitibacter flavus]|uniref:radical SAM family heme chaperone HemW n=1 Tax=Phragmitibacter flavus TaxID=2576071 RepID=UPI00197F12D0|nr:radical SAM family heme chaperone HemW [Phragmitibacter flavus]